MKAEYDLKELKPRRNPYAIALKNETGMTWNFRLVRHWDRKSASSWYGVHEVFYNDVGRPAGMTENPVGVTGESRAEVEEYLKMIQKGIRRLPILDLRRMKWAKWSGLI